MNTTLESMLRFIHLTTSGLLAGSLGFADTPLMPGWHDEVGRDRLRREPKLETTNPLFDAIGPVALGTGIALALGARSKPSRRALDAAAAAALGGVLAATLMGTVPINRKLDERPASDYESESYHSLARNWERAHSVRTALGVGAFLFAAASCIGGGDSGSAHP